MEKILVQQLINLDSFLYFHFVPTKNRMKAWIQHLEGKKSRYEERRAEVQRAVDKALHITLGIRTNQYRASLWEAYLWLHMGSALEYFPREAVLTFLEKNYDDFSDYYESYSAIGDLFPGRLRLALEGAFGRKQKSFLNDLGYAKVLHKPDLAPVFSSLISMQSVFANDPVAQSTVEELTFGDLTSWNSDMNGSIDPEQLASAIAHHPPSTMQITKSTLIAGFFKILRYLANYRSLIEGPDRFAQTNDLTKGELEGSMHWAKDICFWRINFFQREYRRRFMELALSAGGFAIENLGNHGVELPPSASVDAFVKEVEGIIDFWINGVEMTLQSSARA